MDTLFRDKLNYSCFRCLLVKICIFASLTQKQTNHERSDIEQPA